MDFESGKKLKPDNKSQPWRLAFKGGKRGIRTPGTVTRSPHFECGPFDHSGIFPWSFSNSHAKLQIIREVRKDLSKIVHIF